MDFNLGYTLTGFVVGLLVGLTGVGGGSLMTPMLIFAFHVPTAVAIGTDLLFAAITKTAGIIIHHRHSTIHWRIVILMLLGSVPATLLTLYFLKQGMVMGKDYKALLNTVLGIALVLTAVVLFYRNPLLEMSHRHVSKLPGWVRDLRSPLTVVFGAMLGVLVTLSSIGAGALGAAVLTFLYPRMAAIRIAGTDIAHAVPADGHRRHGALQPRQCRHHLAHRLADRLAPRDLPGQPSWGQDLGFDHPADPGHGHIADRDQVPGHLKTGALR